MFHSIALLSALCRRDFMCFVLKSLTVLYPHLQYKPAWHHEAIAHVLDCVRLGKLNRLLVSAPPRSLKSLIISVIYPAFVLGHDPTKQFICASYSQDLANKLADDFRRLVRSEFYRTLFPHGDPLKDTQEEYQTAAGGGRYATLVGGTLKGRGCDCLIIDDPHNAIEVMSKLSRDTVYQWFTGSALSRLNDPAKGHVIVVMQRLHEEDLIGALIEKLGWKHLKLPAIAQEDTAIALSDTYDCFWPAGEALEPDRVSLQELANLKLRLGTGNFNTQYLQSPLPQSGNRLKRDWLRHYDPPLVRMPGDLVVQSWDTGNKATQNADYSVGLTAIVQEGRVYLIDAFRKRLEYPDLQREFLALARAHKPTAILIEDVRVRNVSGAIGAARGRPRRPSGPSGIRQGDPDGVALADDRSWLSLSAA